MNQQPGEKPNEIIVYTDGAALGNPGPGGYGIVMRLGNYRKEFSEGYQLTTNNRMELLAVIVALEKIKRPQSQVVVYSDSRYVVDAVEKNWLRGWVQKGFKKVKNVDLWKRFLEIYPQHQVRFVWVKGHANIPENERCDQLAVAAANAPNLLPDVGYLEVKNPGGLF